MRKVDELLAWDVEVDKAGTGLPQGVCLRMCDVDCGSQTVSMVKKVLEWRKADAEGSKALWDELQGKNEALAAALKNGETHKVGGAVADVRELIRAMGQGSGVPIEPESQTELLDALGGVEGVLGGVVPGAGGFDAVALIMKDDEATQKRVEAFLEVWGREKGARVRLLGVKGEMEGARREELSTYDGWLA